MSFSEASSREKALVLVLLVVIIVALIGIGILLAKLLFGGEGEKAGGITPAPTTAAAEAGDAGPTITPIEASIVQQAELPAEATSPAASGSEPVVLVQVESVGPLAPAMIVNQALEPGHQYRLEVTAQDGTAIAVEGNWSQAATSASGQAAAPQIEFFEGTTPYRIDIAPPVADPKMWGISVSAGFKEADLLAEGPAVVITIWDVTAGE